MTTINFGKYKGLPLSEVPEDYLEWLIETRRKEAATYQAELDRRVMAEEAEGSMAERIVSTGYRKLAETLHPDKGGTDEDMKALNAAREWLRSQAKRKDCSPPWGK